MMAAARVGSGPRGLEIKEFCLNDLVEECCKAAQVLAVNKRVSLSTNPTVDIAFRGDQDLVRRLILNLLDNAIKYTSPGGSISVALFCEPARVKDCGGYGNGHTYGLRSTRLRKILPCADQASLRAEKGAGWALESAGG
jgi:signal transduction histidine kinase